MTKRNSFDTSGPSNNGFIFFMQRKIASWILVFLITFEGLPLFAQTANSQVPGSSFLESSNRETGSSFGSGTNEKMPQLSNQASNVYQEPVFGGLTYQVHVLGEVNKPGTYRFAASTRLSEAVEKAGGILVQGSERNIELRRKGRGVQRIDLLSYKTFGLLDSNPYLLDNDVIYIPLKQKIVQIAGAVKRPALYELKEEQTIEDLVDLAGGFTPGVANPSPVKIIRYDHDKKEILEIENLQENRKNFMLVDADVVVIPHKITKDKKFDYNLSKLPGDNPLFYPSFEERVFVIGAVYVPGAYPYNPYFDFRQYVTLAGGTNKLAKGERRWRIIDSHGKRKRATYNTQINPGDAIIIPEKYMAPESWLSLVLGTSSAILGLTTTVLTLTR